MKIKTSELTGAALRYAAALAEGYYPGPRMAGVPADDTLLLHGQRSSLWLSEYKPDIDWSQGGPIIEREGITVSRSDQKSYVNQPPWVAYRIEHLFGDGYDHEYQNGPTPLIAAMRCYAASKLGDEVDVPEEFL